MQRKTWVLMATIAVLLFTIDDSLAACQQQQCNDCIMKILKDFQTKANQAETDQRLLEDDPDAWLKQHPGEALTDGYASVEAAEKWWQETWASMPRLKSDCLAKAQCSQVERGVGCVE